MPEAIDFTSCRVVLGKAYNGANGKKIAVEYNGTLYMLKFPLSGKNKPQSFPIQTTVSASILPAAFSI